MHSPLFGQDFAPAHDARPDPTYRRVEVNGVHIGVIQRGARVADGVQGEKRRTLVLLHGFTGSAISWGHLLDEFAAAGLYVIALDMLGHGQSDAPTDPERYSIEHCQHDITAVLQVLGVEPGEAVLLGYSLGGRVALYCAFSGFFRALILESASPGLADPALRAQRRESDQALATSIEHDGVEAFVNYWEKLPLFASQSHLAPERWFAQRAQRLANRPEGLANSLRGVGTGAQPSLHDHLPELNLPVALLVGALDTKYCTLAEQMAGRLPQAQLHVAPGAGHSVHLEQPAAFISLVREFFTTLSAGDTTAAPAYEPVILHQDKEKHMPVAWEKVCDYNDIIFEKAEGMGKITINRPEVRNAFRPQTLNELIDAFNRCREDQEIGVVIFTGQGDKAFCSGGDQRVRGEGGYVGDDGVPRLNALDLQKVIKYLPKPVIAMVAGYAIGGGHVLHLLCDLTIAADNARFGQTGPRVGSFDAGWGATYMARVVGHKKAREIWYLCRQYDAQEALDMGLVNTVVPLERLEEETVQWAREILEKSPLALRFLKSAFNADTDGLAGIQELAGNATMLYYMTEEGKEGKNAFLEKRKPDFSKFPRLP